MAKRPTVPLLVSRLYSVNCTPEISRCLPRQHRRTSEIVHASASAPRFCEAASGHQCNIPCVESSIFPLGPQERFCPARHRTWPPQTYLPLWVRSRICFVICRLRACSAITVTIAPATKQTRRIMPHIPRPDSVSATERDQFTACEIPTTEYSRQRDRAIEDAGQRLARSR